MSERGTIFLCDVVLHWYQQPTMTDEDFPEIERQRRSSDVHLDEPPCPYEEDPQAELDRRLAEAIGLPLFEPATDRWRHVWFDGSRLLFPYYPWRESKRLLRASSMDEIVRIVRAAQEVRPTVLATWRGSWGDAPKAGETVAARIQAHDLNRSLYGELLFIGEPGDYRVHEVEYEKPISTYFRWQEREKDWDAIRASTPRAPSAEALDPRMETTSTCAAPSVSVTSAALRPR